MPRMDGITFLRRIMTQHPIPCVIISSLTTKGAATTLKALEYGAVEIITKPQMDTRQFIEESRIKLCDVVKAAAIAKLRKRMITPKENDNGKNKFLFDFRNSFIFQFLSLNMV